MQLYQGYTQIHILNHFPDKLCLIYLLFIRSDYIAAFLQPSLCSGWQPVFTWSGGVKLTILCSIASLSVSILLFPYRMLSLIYFLVITIASLSSARVIYF